MRRATPDSEALASSEDERPWPSATTFGSLPTKENGVPGLGGGIWSSSQSRGSFKLGEQARRNAAREARLAAPGKGSARPANTPSPATSSDHGANSLPFAIPLQPTPKAGRSLSHSQGQREMPPSSSVNIQQAVAGAERPAVLPLGLLNEEIEDDAESDRESELGGMLTQTASHPVFGNAQRTSTLPTQYDSPFSTANSARRSDTFDGSGFDRRFEAAFGELRDLDQHPRRPQWQTSLGWEELPHYSESRRHSMADLPTRRNTIGTGGNHALSASESYDNNYLDTHTDLSNTSNDNEPEVTANMYPTMHAHLNTNMGLTLPAGYQVPHVALEPHERTSNAERAIGMQFANSRPRKLLYIISFKCSRVGCFYLLDNTGLTIVEGDMVIVEADRGQDLGVVQHARVTQDEARTLLAKYGEEQYKWLMMFSNNNQAGAVNPNAAVYGESNGSGNASMPSTRPPRDAFSNLKPKAIKRMAAPHEIRMLREKEGNEAKAKRACQQKVYQHHLDMEILEAEFQWDWQKLIFYYYADHYVNFKDLVNDLYKLYKVRLWMSAVNPASFSPNAINQPPTGIGPGAITSSGAGNGFDTSYTMAYGTDPDPYGAVPPYQLPINTYNPNYPGIPGIHNSFAPMHMMQPMQSMQPLAMGPPPNVQQATQQMVNLQHYQHGYQPVHQLQQYHVAQPVDPVDPVEPVESYKTESFTPVDPKQAKRSKSDRNDDLNVLDYLAQTMLGLDLKEKSASQKPAVPQAPAGPTYQLKTPMRPTPAQPPIQRPQALPKAPEAPKNGTAQESGKKSKIDWDGLGMSRR